MDTEYDAINAELGMIAEVDAQLADLLNLGDKYNESRAFEWQTAVERRKLHEESVGRPVPVLGQLRRRLRRRQDASTLLELTSRLENIEKDPLYLSQEVSLSSTAAAMWSEIGSALGDDQSDSALRNATREAATAMQELGKAAQTSLGSEPAAQEEDMSASELLASAGERARLAVFSLGQAVSKSADGVGGKLDEAWRRDALRAVVALERAPEQLQQELRRQRLSQCRRELRVLGLEKRQLETLTVSDAKAARVAKAKLLHPDVRRSGAAAPAEASSEAAGTTASDPAPPRGLFGMMLGRLLGGGGNDADRVPSEREEDAMAELNTAYEKVQRAISSSS